MTEHLAECCFAPHVCDVNLCQRFHAFCICNQLRVCEERAREDERSNNFTPDDHSNGMTEAYQRGLNAAREAVADLEFWRTNPATISRPRALAAIDALRDPVP